MAQINSADQEGNNLHSNGHSNGDEGDALGNTRPTYGNVVAKMPTNRFDKFYNMNHPVRGIALILNHEHFEISSLKSRGGTNEDRKNLEKMFKELGFQVHAFQDLRHQDIMAHIKDVSRMDHTNCDCLVVAVLTHGDTGILYAKDTPYKPDDLFERFTADKCPTLAGKPKIFLLQACQGDRLDSGVILSRTETDGQPINSYRIPSQADFLMVYSTVKGYYSWRNTTKGSWFIQALCEELKQNAYEENLLTILTLVSQRVAFDFESNCPDAPIMHQQKQIPCVMSMLTRLIQFTKKPVSSMGSTADEISEKPGKSKSIFRGIFKKEYENA